MPNQIGQGSVLWQKLVLFSHHARLQRILYSSHQLLRLNSISAAVRGNINVCWTSSSETIKMVKRFETEHPTTKLMAYQGDVIGFETPQPAKNRRKPNIAHCYWIPEAGKYLWRHRTIPISQYTQWGTGVQDQVYSWFSEEGSEKKRKNLSLEKSANIV